MAESIVRLEVADGVATLTLDAPPLNVFDTPMRQALEDASHRLRHDEDVRAVVLYGGERCFAAGADVEQLAQMDFETVVHWNRQLQETFTSFSSLPMPVVAAVNGYALGGGFELALAADYRIAGDNAAIGLPEVLLGIMPGAGGTQRLTRIVGASRAKELLMSGRRVGPMEALELRLVDEVVPSGETLAHAQEYAVRLARGPRYAIEAIKEAVDNATPRPEAGLTLERALISGLFATRDKETGLESFLRSGPGKADFG